MAAAQANAEAGAFSASGAQFEEGRYTRQGGDERIEIYQYDGETALRIILAHGAGTCAGSPAQ